MNALASQPTEVLYYVIFGNESGLCCVMPIVAWLTFVYFLGLDIISAAILAVQNNLPKRVYVGVILSCMIKDMMKL